ncbi:alpha-amylase family glycosyl hydrolase [Propionibacteriaceae bacterium G1746]
MKRHLGRPLAAILSCLAMLVGLAVPAMAGPPAPSTAPAGAPSIGAVPTAAPDGNVEWDGLKHDSRSTVYRTPQGAVPEGTAVTIRFRTFQNDVTSVDLRLYSVADGRERVVAMTRAATGVSCYEPRLAASSCDYWEHTLPADHQADNLWYRFIIKDGAKTVYYADDTAALDGGPGRPSDTVVDNSWALMLHVPGFTSPAWAPNQVVYQIFPDRFANGRSNNDAKSGDTRYDDPVLKLAWGTQPEGYCRNYAGATTSTCPWRYPPVPTWGQDQKETPRGRDYFGGDLKGVDQQLPYLQQLGVTTLYFNPIFDAGSNHSYDTQDYYRIDPYFGTQKDYDNLIKHARALGIRVILDGVFNHMSSDSPMFDRYGHYPTVGACESVDSPYRKWFTFQPQAGGPCAGPGGPNTMNYEAWFGFDSIPVLTKSLPQVQEYFLTSTDSVAKHWLRSGASGWRMDVSTDASFPNGYWQTFREVVKGTNPEALTISEAWQKNSETLRQLRGDQLDTTMNYRLRDAVIGLLAPQPFDAKGFPDSGYQLSPSQFLNRLSSVREDYPDAAYYSLLNILDSHDTERILWSLTPGAYGPERDAAAAKAAGTKRLALATLIQFTQAGMPTIYYGDEVGLTGADDPDDRRTYPWGSGRDMALYNHYATLAKARAADPALTQGDFAALLADDANGTLAYGRKIGTRGGIVVVNTATVARTITVPVRGYLPDGTKLSATMTANMGQGAKAVVADGQVIVTLPAGAAAWFATGEVDLSGPGATSLRVGDVGSGTVALDWSPVEGAVAYNVYGSPLSGGGWVKLNQSPITETTFTATGLTNAQRQHFIVRAIDAAGNEGAESNEVTATPRASIGWANLQWPPTLTATVSASARSAAVYGQVWSDGLTEAPGQAPGIRAQVGFGPQSSAPDSPDWAWQEAAFNVQAGNNDEYVATLPLTRAGMFDYVYRYSTDDGQTWLYADLSGPVAGNAPATQPGTLTVLDSDDTTPPAVPTGLAVVTAGPSQVSLTWQAVTDDPTLYGYEVGRRAAGSSDGFVVIGSVTGTTFTDTSAAQGSSYDYAVRAVDQSANISPWSAHVTATADARQVDVVFTVTVPAGSTPVHIAGSLVPLGGAEWDPTKGAMTQLSDTQWRITLTGIEGASIQYKYALGSWDFVEKDSGCGEIGNRLLTLSYGSDGTMNVTDTVANWRNVSPCGN